MTERLINIIITRVLRSIKNIGKTIWSLTFRGVLVPGYRLFLYLQKNINKFLLQNPLLSVEQNKKNLKSSTLLHIIMGILVIWVLVNNFATRETYAEEFGKNSILAELLTEDAGEEIVTKSKPLQEWASVPKTENILDQLGAIKAKHNTGLDGKIQEEDKKINDQVALVQGGDALLKPTITPFENEDKPGSTDGVISERNEVQYYFVKSGDTLSQIAKKFGISINTILWENNLSLSSYIKPGDKLAILPVSGVSYSVRSGDTLSKIANEFGTNIDKIVSFNNIDPSGVLSVRQKIIIPGGKLGYASPSPSRSIGSIKNIFSPSSGSVSDGNFMWPSISKRITQYYHWRHHAIDIGAKTGTPIYATRGGRIERSGWSKGYGYNIVINHGGGVKTLYAHASKLYVKRGDQVEQGAVIGGVGSTGWSTGPHIHFELIINGKKVNPLSYL